MKYQPDAYINKIRVRDDDYESLPNQTPLFDTWEGARSWMINDRLKKLDKAKRAYVRVFDMKPKNKIG